MPTKKSAANAPHALTFFYFSTLAFSAGIILNYAIDATNEKKSAQTIPPQIS